MWEEKRGVSSSMERGARALLFAVPALAVVSFPLQVILLKSLDKAAGIYAVRRPVPGIWGSALSVPDTAIQVAV